MIVRTGILGLAALLFVACATVEAQQRRGTGATNTTAATGVRGGLDRLAGMRQRPRYISSATSNRNRRGTYQDNMYSGVLTRMDQVRAMLPRRGPSLVRGFDPIAPSPIQAMLDRRNLLSVRSPIARKTASGIGRTIKPAGIEPAPGAFTFIPPAQTMTTTPTTQPSVRAETSYQDDLANRLGRMADEYYQSGLLAFTKGEWISARSYFDLVRELEPENPRAYLALTMVSTQRSEFATGWMFILKAVALSKNADELRIDISRFFTNPDGFRKTREAVNNAAQKYPDFASAAGLLAYYSFLNGDVGTASDAAANAEKNTPEDFAEPIKKFRSMLLEARTSAASRPAK